MFHEANEIFSIFTFTLIMNLANPSVLWHSRFRRIKNWTNSLFLITINSFIQTTNVLKTGPIPFLFRVLSLIEPYWFQVSLKKQQDPIFLVYLSVSRPNYQIGKLKLFDPIGFSKSFENFLKISLFLKIFKSICSVITHSPLFFV